MRKHHKDDNEVAVKSRGEENLGQTGTGSAGSTTWKCLACGAYNDDSVQVCSECTAMRAGAEATPKKEEITEADILNWEAPANEQAAAAEPEIASSEPEISADPQVEASQAEPDEQFSAPVVSSPIEAPIEAPSF